MPHPLINQLRFTRSEFMRGVKGITNKDALKRLLPMNCISWNIGHLGCAAIRPQEIWNKFQRLSIRRFAMNDDTAVQEIRDKFTL